MRVKLRTRSFWEGLGRKKSLKKVAQNKYMPTQKKKGKKKKQSVHWMPMLYNGPKL